MVLRWRAWYLLAVLFLLNRNLCVIRGCVNDRLLAVAKIAVAGPQPEERRSACHCDKVDRSKLRPVLPATFENYSVGMPTELHGHQSSKRRQPAALNLPVVGQW